MLKLRHIMQWHGAGDEEVHGWPIRRNFVSQCECFIYEIPKADDSILVVVFSESRDGEIGTVNEGASITNSFEYVATLAARQWPELSKKPVNRVTWIQHYAGKRDGDQALGGDGEVFDLVELAVNLQEKRFCSPQWKPFSRQELEELIGETFPL